MNPVLNKNKYNFKRLIYIITILLLIFILLNISKVYAANIKFEISPKNPRIGDDVELRVKPASNDINSLSFLSLDESSNLEYIDMDSMKKAFGGKSLIENLTAKFKLNKTGDTWIKANIKIEYAGDDGPKINPMTLKEKIVEETIKINIIPEVEDIEEVNAKFNVTDNDVNIRPYPSTKYSSIGYKKKNDILDVTGKKDEWYQFKYNDDFGYIHSDFVKEIISEEEKVEEKVEEKIGIEDKVEEEVRDPKIKDPRDVKDNTTMLIVLSVLLGLGIIVSIIYLIKDSVKGKNNKKEDNI